MILIITVNIIYVPFGKNSKIVQSNMGFIITYVLPLCKPVGFDYRTSTEKGKQTLGGHKQNLVCTRTQEKGAVTPEETESDLPVSVQESPVEAWVDSGLLGDQGHGIQQCRELQSAGLSPFEGSHNYCHYPCHRDREGGNRKETQPHPLTENWIKDLLTWSHPSDPDFPTPVHLIRKLPQASYPYEGRQNKNYN